MPFTDEQMDYMRSIGLDLDFNNLSDDDWVNIEDTVGDRLVCHGLDSEDGYDYKANEEGEMCYSILDRLD